MVVRVSSGASVYAKNTAKSKGIASMSVREKVGGRARVARRVAALAGLIGFLATAIVAAAPPALAMNITVTTTADVIANDGRCSLAEAVIAAENDAPSGTASGECPAGSGADVITIPAGTYTRGPGFGTWMNLTTDVTFNGAGADDTTLDANFIGRHLLANGGAITMRGLTLVNGSTTGNGGSLLVLNAPLTILDSVLSNNRAGFGGGAITHGGLNLPLALNRTTVSDNFAVGNANINSGGGIEMSYGSILNSTISGNRTDGDGGGAHTTGEVLFSNVTISDNQAGGDGGGIHRSIRPIDISFSTITNNRITGGGAGSGVNAGSGSGVRVTLSASIVVNNTGGSDVASASSDGFASGDFNVVGFRDALSFGSPLGNDLVDQAGASLGPLANNGGPTRTHALQNGSTAINRVTGAVGSGIDEPADQRGVGRPANQKDSGAYEAVVCNGRIVTINLNTNGGLGSGTSGADVILGTPNADTINGLGGNDTICAGGGNDTVSGGLGADTVFAGPGDDYVTGGDGNDALYGADGSDSLFGGNGIDRLFGQGGNDFAYGGNDDDRVAGGSGNDHLEGNAGLDRVWGQSGNDDVFGNGGDDLLFGGLGVDMLDGSTGNDTLNGQAGNDTLIGGSGADTLYGAVDNDDLDGGTGNDFLYGNGGDDTMDGGDDDDELYGAGGADDIVGGTGDDSLYGQGANDTLSGGVGTDLCNGGVGNDSEDGTCETSQGIP